MLFQGLLNRAFTGNLTAEWEAANAEFIADQQALYERLPQLVLLAFLHEKSARAKNRADACVLITALMKYVFLFQMKTAARRRLYHFVPYHYGPFARELYTDLQALSEQGLITLDNGDEDRTRISLTQSGDLQSLFSDIPEDIKDDVGAVLDTYGYLSHKELLRQVYEKYPAYTGKSRLKL